MRAVMPASRRSLAIAAVAFLAAAPGQGAAQLLPGAEPPPDIATLLRAEPPPYTVRPGFSLAIAGDLLYSQPVVDKGRNPLFEPIRRLIGGADVAVANLEMPFFDLKTFKGAPGPEGLLLGSPGLGVDVQAMGFDMVSLANNHSTDWGYEGLSQTIRLLDEAGVRHAGGGTNLAEARRPAYFDTPKGRVAFVSTTSTFKSGAMANDAIDDMPPRPGVSILRTERISVVSEAEMATLRRIAVRQSFGRSRPPAIDAPEIKLNDTTYRVGERPGLAYEMNRHDEYGILSGIGEARRNSDLVIFTIHAHESPTGLDDDNPVPPDFLVRLFHNAVDAGADVIVGGGPHSMRGIEIYKGRPIFYGVGTMFLTGEIYLSQEIRQMLPIVPPGADKRPPTTATATDIARAKGGNPRNWYESVVATIDYGAKDGATVRLYPLDLGPEKDRPDRGMPELAAPPVAREILASLQQASATFGTRIEIEGNVGVIRLPPLPAKANN